VDARLRIVIGLSTATTVSIPHGKTIIGRENECQLRLNSDFVSRRHCVLLLEEETLRIHDEGSKNGTFVNGRRIGPADTILRHGDLVSIGATVFEVSLDPAVGTGVGQAISGTEPAISPTALDTGVFQGDTVNVASASIVSPPSAPPAPTPVVPCTSSAPPRS
jgi:pSer/pThr/pTyr-binding forkhead associated (FHA) protein